MDSWFKSYNKQHQNSSTRQDDQNEWSQCSIWTAGSKATTNNTKTVLLGKTIKTNGHSVVFGQLVQKLQQTTPKQFYSARRSKWMVTGSVIFGQLVQSYNKQHQRVLLGKYQNEWWQCSIWTAGSKATTNNTKTVQLGKTIKMNGHWQCNIWTAGSKLQQTTPKSSTRQDDQNEWSQCSIWTAGSKVTTNNIKTVLLGKTIKMNGHWQCSIWTAGSKVRTNNTKQFYSARRSKWMVTM